MMENKKKDGMFAGILLRLVCCILLVFTLLGTLSAGAGSLLLGTGDHFLVKQLVRSDVPEKVHDSLQGKFDAAYHTTAVPAEVYMDVLTVEWLSDAMTQMVQAEFAGDSGTEIDYTPLADSVTAYFAAYAEENQVAQDTVYTEKLAEVIESAEKTVGDTLDVYHIQTMKKAGIWQKAFRLEKPLLAVCVICGILSVLLVIFLRSWYWIGVSLFADGLLLTGTAGGILGSGIIRRFTLKEPGVYAAFTGVMGQLTTNALWTGLILLGIGTILWLGSTLKGKK